jgi:hypothetical protein
MFQGYRQTGLGCGSSCRGEPGIFPRALHALVWKGCDYGVITEREHVGSEAAVRFRFKGECPLRKIIVGAMGFHGRRHAGARRAI